MTVGWTAGMDRDVVVATCKYPVGFIRSHWARAIYSDNSTRKEERIRCGLDKHLFRGLTRKLLSPFVRTMSSISSWQRWVAWLEGIGQETLPVGRTSYMHGCISLAAVQGRMVADRHARQGDRPCLSNVTHRAVFLGPLNSPSRKVVSTSSLKAG